MLSFLARWSSRFPARKAPRLASLFVLTAIACWGEPGARGAASPPAEPIPTGQDEAADSAEEPVLVPAQPPSPLPPEETPTLPPARPAPAPSTLGSRLAPKLGALSAWVKTRHAELGVAVRDLGSGREIAGEGQSRALNPASNEKLITAAVALSELGPDFRFHVGVFGKLEGDQTARLVIRGNGDPSFSYAELRGFAERLVELGLRHVSGGIRVDQSAFDDQYTPPAFEQQPDEWAAFRAPVSAVALERNSITLRVFPSEAGQLARVTLEPPGYAALQGQVRTKRGQKRDHVGFTLHPRGLLLGAEVSGDIPADGGGVQITRRIENPEIYAGMVLKQALVSLGVDVQGEVARGGEDESTELVGRDSSKLSELTQQLGKASDNFYAETLFKAVAAEKRGKPGTARSAAELELAWLEARKLEGEGLTIQNGSGLYDANRVSARTFTRVLELAYLDPVISRPYCEQLAVGGVDGTLRTRFYALRNRRSVRAKTGTLNKVTALSGYVFGPEQRTGIAFSILVTGTSDHAGARQRMDDLVLEISDGLWEHHEGDGPVAQR